MAYSVKLALRNVMEDAVDAALHERYEALDWKEKGRRAEAATAQVAAGRA